MRFGKFLVLSVFFLAVLLSLTAASASSHYYDSPYFSTERRAYDLNPRHSSGIRDFLINSFSSGSKSDFSRRNFDSSSLNFDYRGPMYERQIILKDELNFDRDDTNFLFFSDSDESLHKSSTAILTEKFVGSSESLFINSQNRRSESFESERDEDYDDGFSWRKARLFDPSEYSGGRYNDYYYRPYYDSKAGHYNWRW